VDLPAKGLAIDSCGGPPYEPSTVTEDEMVGLRFAILTLTLFATSGCGTLFNLTAPPKGMPCIGPSTCFPLGGLTPSTFCGLCGPPAGLGGMVYGDILVVTGQFKEGFQTLGISAAYAGAGFIALADIPLSLGGDLVTFPIAYARYKEYPWATWWGDQSW